MFLELILIASLSISIIKSLPPILFKVLKASLKICQTICLFLKITALFICFFSLFEKYCAESVHLLIKSILNFEATYSCI